MSYINADNINQLHIELSDWCNAACPMCSRFNWDGTLATNKVNSNHLSLKIFKEAIGPDILKNIRALSLCGTYGDAIMNPECLDIIQYIRSVNSIGKITLQTNGGVRNTEFWKELGKIENLETMFGIDGLQDTNHLYRRNVVWDKLMHNVQTYIDAGGSASWQFIVFRHNEHQITQAEEMSKQMKFINFNLMYSERWAQRSWTESNQIRIVDQLSIDNYALEPPLSQPTSTVAPNAEPFNLTKTIVCKVASNNIYEVYIRANGQVYPCCMVGDYDSAEVGELISDPKLNNLNYTPLMDILNGDFFSKIYQGILGTAGCHRLKNCFYTCGLNEESNGIVKV